MLWRLSFACADDPWAVSIYRDHGSLYTASLHLVLETQGCVQTNASKFSSKGKNYHTLSSEGTSFIQNHNEKCETAFQNESGQNFK